MVKFALIKDSKEKAKNAKKRQSGYMPRYYFYFINILFCISLQAQEPQDLFLNESSLEKLSKGNLLVRLESKDKKIQFLTKEMKAKDCDAKCRKKLEGQINDIIHARDLFNLQFIESFKYYFAFCPVYFYYDKDHQELVNAQFKGNLYLDEKLNTININSINKDSILILKKDVTPESENEGWLFQTAEGITLKYGFPYITINNSKTLWTWLSSSDHLEKNCNYLVEKLNKNLYEYYVKRDERAFGEDNAPAMFKGAEGYYITNELDTVKVRFDLPKRFLKNEISYIKLQSEVTCKDSLNKKITLTPKMIKEFSFYYGLEKIRMIAIHNKNSFHGYENRFLYLKTDGKLKLYYEYELDYIQNPGPEPHGGTFQTSRHFVLQLENKPLHRFHDFSFRKDLIEYIKDCPELTKKINDKLYDREDIPLIVNEFNTICGN